MKFRKMLLKKEEAEGDVTTNPSNQTIRRGWRCMCSDPSFQEITRNLQVVFGKGAPASTVTTAG